MLRNTFNLVTTTPTQEIEFSMLDQENFAGINDYVQKHGLQDASMAAARRAKKLNINPPADKENGAPAAVGEEEESELQKAERELQDQEDDEEEDDDFDPGSEGESEGEGSESEDEEGEGGYDEGDTAQLEGEDEEMED